MRAPTATGDLLGLMEGRRRREVGMERADGAELEWGDRVRKAIKALALQGSVFTADEVRDVVGDPEHPNAMGAALMAMHRAGVIQPVGWRQSTRPEGHARTMRSWMGAGR